MMREIITRYGRHNLGFAWLFVEPMIFTLGIATLWALVKASHSGLPIIPFAVIGYSTVLLWRNIANKVGNAVQANAGLLFHRNVKVLDVFLARTFLEMASATSSFLILSIFFHFLGYMPYPDNFLLMAFGWGLLAWFGTAFGLVIGAVHELSEVVEKLWHPLTYILFPLSGAAFFVDWLPKDFAKIVLYVPMVHYTEMIRHGYYGSLIPTYENLSYIIWTNVILSFLGLMLVRYISTKLEIGS